MPDPPSRRARFVTRVFGGVSGKVFRGMLTLALGSGVGRVIGVATMPVLTRLYTPEDFGVLAVFTALVAILAPLVTLRYALPLPLPHHNGVAMNLLALSLGLTLTLSVLIALMLWAFGAPLFAMVSMDVLAPWWWLIPLGVLGTASYELLTMWATRRRAYRVIAQTNVTQSAASALVKIGMGLAGAQPLGLLLGQVVAQTGGVGRLLSEFSTEFKSNWRHVGASRMRKVAWRYQGFVIWRVPSELLNVVSMQAPMLFMAALYDPETTGQFGLAVMALSIPITLFGQSAGRALYGEASVVMKTDPGRVVIMCKQVQFRLLMIALPPAAVIFFFGDDIFWLLFSSEWTQAGVFASLLSMAMIFQFTSAPLIQVMSLLTNQASFLILNILRFAGLAMVFFIATRFSFEANQTVLFFSFYSAIFYLSVTVFVLRKLPKEAA